MSNGANTFLRGPIYEFEDTEEPLDTNGADGWDVDFAALNQHFEPVGHLNCCDVDFLLELEDLEHDKVTLRECLNLLLVLGAHCDLVIFSLAVLYHLLSDSLKELVELGYGVSEARLPSHALQDPASILVQQLEDLVHHIKTTEDQLDVWIFALGNLSTVDLVQLGDEEVHCGSQLGVGLVVT